MSTSIDTSSILQQLRTMALEAGIPSGAPLVGISPSASKFETEPPDDVIDFSQILENSLQSVNTRSVEARELRESFELGSSNVELADVMIAAQKARISFEALTQVRNKMVSAYREIMSMPL